MSEQTRYKSKMLMALMLVFALWATVAIAGVNEDFLEAAEHGDLPAVKNFIDNGADVNTKRDDGITALIFASQNGYKEIVELLLAKGADVNVKDIYGVTALMGASYSGVDLHGHKDVVELLLAKGADVNVKDIYGRTALIRASHKGNKDVVELLLAKGANINAEDNIGETALKVAYDKDVEQLLIRAGAKLNSNPQLKARLLKWEKEAPRDITREIKRLRHGDAVQRAYAAIELGEKSSRAKGAIIALIETLSDNTSLAFSNNPKNEATTPSWEAVEALAKIGKPAVEPLIAALKDHDRAADALVKIGKRAVEPLIAALKDENIHVRSNAVYVLGEIKDQRAVEPLIAALKDENIHVRARAADALRKIDQRALPRLLRHW